MVVTAATGASRILGFVRDILLASLFPAHLVDPFIVAFRIPNSLRRFVAEGAFSISFVPVYSKLEKEEDQRQLLSSLFTILSLGLGVLTLVLIWFAPQLIGLYAPAFREEAVPLLRIMLPYLAFLSLVALCMGVLNSHGHFFSPAIAPVLLNVFFIGAMLFQSKTQPGQMSFVAWAIMASGFFQLALQWPFLKRIGRLPQFSLQWWTPSIKRITGLWLPAMWSVSIVQITTLIGTHFGSLLPTGTITGLYLAERIVELPLGVFAVAIGTVSLPVLSRLLRQGGAEFDGALNQGLILSFLFSVPSAVGIFVLSEPLVKAFFFRDQFDPVTVSITTESLRAYAWGIPFGSLLRSFAAAYHAHERMKLPAVLSTLILIFYFVFCSLTFESLRHQGLALGSSLSIALNGILLLVLFHVMVRPLVWRPLVGPLFKICGAAALMGVGVWGLSYWFTESLGGIVVGQKWVQLLACTLTGVTIYAVAGHVLGLSEITVVFNKIRSRIRS